MRTIWVLVMVLGLMSGCSGKRSSLLMERRVRGTLAEEPAVGMRIMRRLEPMTQTQAQQGVGVTVAYASSEYLQTFFNNRAVFGGFAGKNPFFLENIVFYVKVANQSEKKITVDPTEFVLVDDRGNQYPILGTDYITAFAESHLSVASMTRGVLEEARPGYFGLSLPVGKMFASKPQGRFALLSMSTLKSGAMFPDTVYDGLVYFWNIHEAAKKVRLILTGIKTDFAADDLPKTSLTLTFDFDVAAP